MFPCPVSLKFRLELKKKNLNLSHWETQIFVYQKAMVLMKQ